MIGTSTFLGYVRLWPHHAGRCVAVASSDRARAISSECRTARTWCRWRAGHLPVQAGPPGGGPKGVKPRSGVSTYASGAAKAVAVGAVVDECAVVRVVRQDGG